MILDSVLEKLCGQPEADLDLAEVALHLARDEFPHLDVEGCLGEFNALARDARSYLGQGMNAQVHGLCRYLFHELGFRGNAKHYNDPRNSYLNLVLDRRLGIPITLSAVVMAVGQRVGVPFVGLGLPGHFIIKAAEADILVDPFHGGRLITWDDCENLVRQMTGKAIPIPKAALRALPLGLMLERWLNNLRVIYLQEQDFVRAGRVLGRLRQLNPDNVHYRRDLGLCLLRQGWPGKALDHLKAYIQTAQEAEDLDTVAKLLRESERQLAQWN